MSSVGGGVATFLLWLWVTMAVGPWWVGVGILLVGMAVNVFVRAMQVFDDDEA